MPDELYEEAHEEPMPASESDGEPEEWIDAPADWEEPRQASEPTFVRQVPEPGGRIRMGARPRSGGADRVQEPGEPEPPTTTMEAVPPRQERLAELLDEPEPPRGSHPTSDRVAYLFPRPETTEWDVREINYDRRRRARVTGLLRLFLRSPPEQQTDRRALAGDRSLARGLLTPRRSPCAPWPPPRTGSWLISNQSAQVVDVLVQVGDLDHRSRAHLGCQPIDVARSRAARPR